MGRIAVIGSGIAGLGAAWALDEAYDVVVYEAEDRAGGHAHTVDVADEDGPVAVDTGFIVYNEPNYPHLTRLFETLRVPTEPSDMSFAVSVDHRFEFQSRAARMFSPPTNAARPQLWRMLGEFHRFCREAPQVMASGTRESLGSFLARRDYHPAFCANLLLPMTAAIWSCGVEDVRAFPVTTLLTFFTSHGMLQIGDRPAWRTVTGGSTQYVARLTAGFRDRIRLLTPVVSVRRDPTGVSVRDGSGRTEVYDHVVFATHADTTLRILGDDATVHERSTLGAFGFTANTAVLHRDPSLMPRRRAVWASWNYLGDAARNPVGLTYWMNRLQNLRTRRPVFVTLNPTREPRGTSTRFSYSHPRVDRAAVDAQARVPALQGVRRSWFAGAWTGYGFHEDGLRSGLEVADALGTPAPWASHSRPALTPARA